MIHFLVALDIVVKKVLRYIHPTFLVSQNNSSYLFISVSKARPTAVPLIAFVHLNVLILKNIEPTDIRKAFRAGNHHIISTAGAMDDEQIAILIPPAHNAHMAIVRVKHQVAGLSLAP